MKNRMNKERLIAYRIEIPGKPPTRKARAIPFPSSLTFDVARSTRPSKPCPMTNDCRKHLEKGQLPIPL